MEARGKHWDATNTRDAEGRSCNVSGKERAAWSGDKNVLLF